MSKEKQIEALREFSNKKLLSVYGECLEGIGIRNPRKVVRDKSLKPKVGDIVHFHRDINFIDSYIKQVKSYDPETEQFTVGTCYTDPSRDFTFVPEKIHGVITEIYDGDGFLVYERKDYRKQSEWISVEERLPKADTDVLVITANGSFKVGRCNIYHNGTLVLWMTNDGLGEKAITQWRPLPEPPKKEGR